MGAVGGVVHDQGEADDEMSVKQRLVLAGGSALSEGGDAVGDVTGLEVVAEILEVAGKHRVRRFFFCSPLPLFLPSSSLFLPVLPQPFLGHPVILQVTGLIRS